MAETAQKLPLSACQHPRGTCVRGRERGRVEIRIIRRARSRGFGKHAAHCTRGCRISSFFRCACAQCIGHFPGVFSIDGGTQVLRITRPGLALPSSGVAISVRAGLGQRMTKSAAPARLRAVGRRSLARAVWVRGLSVCLGLLCLWQSPLSLGKPKGRGAAGSTDKPPQTEAGRSAWVLSQIAAKNATMSVAQRNEKYAQMGQSLMSFFRATNYLYWAEYSQSPLLQAFGGNKTTRIWLHGDCHAENINAINGLSGGIVYALDDFDDAVIGDYQMDLWRLAISVSLLLREQGQLNPEEEQQAIDALSRSYLQTLSRYVNNNDERTATISAANTTGVLHDFLVDLADRNSRQRMLDKLTSTAGGKRMFDFYNPEIVPVKPGVQRAIEVMLPSYVDRLPRETAGDKKAFVVKSIAQRFRGGMGSLGIARYYVLLEGATSGQDDDMMLDIKAQQEPAAGPFLTAEINHVLQSVTRGDPALRTVLASRALSAHADRYLGVLGFLGGRYSVRERTPTRTPLDVRALTGPGRMVKLAEIWGTVLATAHARADNDNDAKLIPYSFEDEVLKRVGDQQEAFVAHVRKLAITGAAQLASDHEKFSKQLLKPGGRKP